MAPASVQRVLRQPETALHPDEQAGAHQRFGFDFSSVRVQADADAAASARDRGKSQPNEIYPIIPTATSTSGLFEAIQGFLLRQTERVPKLQSILPRVHYLIATNRLHLLDGRGHAVRSYPYLHGIMPVPAGYYLNYPGEPAWLRMGWEVGALHPAFYSYGYDLADKKKQMMVTAGVQFEAWLGQSATTELSEYITAHAAGVVLAVSPNAGGSQTAERSSHSRHSAATGARKSTPTNVDQGQATQSAPPIHDPSQNSTRFQSTQPTVEAPVEQRGLGPSDANAPAYPAKLINLGESEMVSGASSDFQMQVDRGSDVAAHLQRIHYRWELLQVPNVPPDQQAAKARTMPYAGNDLWRTDGITAKIAREDNAAREDAAADRATTKLGHVIQAVTGVTSVMGVSALWRMATVRASYFSVINEPSNTQSVGWGKPGIYFVRCVATPVTPPIEGIPREKQIIRASSVDVAMVRVSNIYERAREANLALTPARLKMLNAELKSLPKDSPRYRAILDQIAKIRAHHEWRSEQSLQGQTNRVEALQTRMNTAQDLLRFIETLAEAPDATAVQVLVRREEVEQLIAGLTEELSEARARLDDAKKLTKGMTGKIFQPYVTFVSEDDGSVHHLSMMLGEAADSREGRRHYQLVDMSTPQAQRKYGGTSAAPGSDGHVLAIERAFTDFCENNRYGRGAVAVELSAAMEKHLGFRPAIRPWMRSAPGAVGRWKERAKDLTEIALTVSSLGGGGAMAEGGSMAGRKLLSAGSEVLEAGKVTYGGMRKVGRWAAGPAQRAHQALAETRLYRGGQSAYQGVATRHAALVERLGKGGLMGRTLLRAGRIGAKPFEILHHERVSATINAVSNLISQAVEHRDRPEHEFNFLSTAVDYVLGAVGAHISGAILDRYKVNLIGDIAEYRRFTSTRLGALQHTRRFAREQLRDSATTFAKQQAAFYLYAIIFNLARNLVMARVDVKKNKPAKNDAALKGSVEWLTSMSRAVISQYILETDWGVKQFGQLPAGSKEALGRRHPTYLLVSKIVGVANKIIIDTAFVDGVSAGLNQLADGSPDREHLEYPQEVDVPLPLAPTNSPRG